MINAQRYIVTLLAGMIFGLVLACIGKGCKPSSPAKPIVLHDTISVTDTIRIAGKTKTLYVRDTIIAYKEVTKEHTKADSLINECTPYKEHTKADTLIYAAKEYRDTFATDTSSIELAVAFSGYNARIDSVGINYHFEVQPRVERQKRGFGWCVMPSVQVGYGVAFGNTIIAAPYVGVGVAVGWGYHF